MLLVTLPEFNCGDGVVLEFVWMVDGLKNIGSKDLWSMEEELFFLVGLDYEFKLQLL